MTHRIRHSLFATALAGVILATSACGSGTTTPEPSASATEAPSATAASSSSSPSASATPSPDYASGDDLKGTHGLKIKGIAENEHGQYLQITIADNDPALAYKPEIIDTTITGKFSQGQILEAQKFALTFAVEEMFDSTVNGGYESINAWAAKNESRIAPKLRQDFKNALQANKEVLNLKSWGSENAGSYTYVYDKDSTRILGYEVRPTSIVSTPDAPEAIGFKFDYDYNIVVQNIETKDIFPVHVKGKGHVFVENNEGAWQVVGIQTQYEGFAPSGK
jgi:hypothetical protein